MRKRAIKNIGLILFILLVLCLPLKNNFIRNSFACNQGGDDIFPPDDDIVVDDDIIGDDDIVDDDDDDIIIPGELKYSPVVEPEAPDREAKEAVTIFEGSYWSGD